MVIVLLGLELSARIKSSREELSDLGLSPLENSGLYVTNPTLAVDTCNALHGTLPIEKSCFYICRQKNRLGMYEEFLMYNREREQWFAGGEQNVPASCQALSRT